MKSGAVKNPRAPVAAESRLAVMARRARLVKAGRGRCLATLVVGK